MELRAPALARLLSVYSTALGEVLSEGIGRQPPAHGPGCPLCPQRIGRGPRSRPLASGPRGRKRCRRRAVGSCLRRAATSPPATGPLPFGLPLGCGRAPSSSPPRSRAGGIEPTHAIVNTIHAATLRRRSGYVSSMKSISDLPLSPYAVARCQALRIARSPLAARQSATSWIAAGKS